MKIGNIELKNNLVLAPMAGYTDAAFRTLCRQQGASLAYTEMISAKALFYKNKNTLPLLQLAHDEGPVAVQLFGNDPVLLADEAQKLESEGYDIFDINMACPVPKVVNNGEGSALMLEPDRVAAIVRTMSDRLKKPVSVKIRKGFDDNNINAVEIARIAQDNGAAMVAVHGRTRQQMYHGKADYEIIRKVKNALDIPVLGSGDIYTREDAVKMMDETGVDGVMVARGARGNPWIFRQITDPDFRKPGIEEVKAMILKHLDLMLEYQPADPHSGVKDPSYSVRQMRKHVGFYSMGFANSAAFRKKINSCDTLDSFIETLTMWKA